jgi:hypothetical protein
MAKKKNTGRQNEHSEVHRVRTNRSFDEVARESESNEPRKPGSQSYSSKQNNTGRGGGK